MAVAQDKPGGAAIASLVLGILSFFGFSILTAIPAWIFGNSELKAIAEGRSPAGGRTMASIGMWLGIINTGLTVLAILLWILIAAGLLGGYLSLGR